MNKKIIFFALLFSIVGYGGYKYVSREKNANEETTEKVVKEVGFVNVGSIDGDHENAPIVKESENLKDSSKKSEKDNVKSEAQSGTESNPELQVDAQSDTASRAVLNVDENKVADLKVPEAKVPEAKFSSNIESGEKNITELNNNSINSDNSTNNVSSEASTNASKINEEDIKTMVIDTINKNPKIIINSLESYYKEKSENEKNVLKDKINSLKSELENDPDSPTIGNANGAIKVIEFFDYSCGYCKKAAEIHKAILLDNKDVQFIFKELPILGEQSYNATRASLAVNMMDKTKYEDFQVALFNFSGNKNDTNMVNIASTLGINNEDFIKKLNDPSILKIIKNNIQLAEALNVRGTPSYIIAGEFYPGAIDVENMQKIIEDARTKIKNTANSDDKAVDSSSTNNVNNANANDVTNDNSNTKTMPNNSTIADSTTSLPAAVSPTNHASAIHNDNTLQSNNSTNNN